MVVANQAAVNKVLGSNLQRTDLAYYQIDPDNKHASMAFVDPKSGEPEFASRSQVAIAAMMVKNRRPAGVEGTMLILLDLRPLVEA